MRDNILKIYVKEENFRMVKAHGCREISFLKRSDNLPVKKCDFIIFSDQQGNEVLRNLWELKEHRIHYTTGWIGNSDDFSLIVIAAHLYESLMHLRHEMYFEKKFFKNFLDCDMIKKELSVIRLCIQILEGHMDLKDYVMELDCVTTELFEYSFESSGAIIKQYPFHYTSTQKREDALNKIKAGVYEIEKCLPNPKDWEEVSRIAYKIHNEPAIILEG